MTLSTAAATAAVSLADKPRSERVAGKSDLRTAATTAGAAAATGGRMTAGAIKAERKEEWEDLATTAAWEEDRPARATNSFCKSEREMSGWEAKVRETVSRTEETMFSGSLRESEEARTAPWAAAAATETRAGAAERDFSRRGTRVLTESVERPAELKAEERSEAESSGPWAAMTL